MSFHSNLPHAFLVILIVIVAIFVLKSLIKFAIIIGAVGLLVYLVWWLDVFNRFAAVPRFLAV